MASGSDSAHACAELNDLLTGAFGAPASPPAARSLGGGIEAEGYWSFAPSLEVVLARANAPVAVGAVRSAWRSRLDRRPIPLVLLVAMDGQVVVVGPGGDPPPVVALEPRLVVEELTRSRTLDPLEVRRRLPEVWDRAAGAVGLVGLRNVGLLSSHYLRERAPRLPEWGELKDEGRAAATARSLEQRLAALGFQAERHAEGIYYLRVEGQMAAAVLSYPEGEDLDRAASGGELPVAGLLQEMDAMGTAWGVLAAGDIWRLYSAEHPARTTSFVEVDVTKLTDPTYFAALFSARALRRGGLAETIAQGARDFAVGLGDRLRDRIYVEVVPRIARAIARAFEEDRGNPPTSREELSAVYEATLTLLYRLLFVLYAEARGYLPAAGETGYREHSLRARLDAIVRTVEQGRAFDPGAHDIWSDLQETFQAVARGHTEWGIPPYNGGLFDDERDSAGANLLARLEPANAELGEALFQLAVDPEDEGSGRIDYADLEIRHLGDIYEGLLQFEPDRARVDLAYDAARDSYVPAAQGDEVQIPEGELYLRSRGGGRKASGSYYTPQIVVRHVVEEALVPELDRHLERVAGLVEQGDEEGAARELWTFCVCDPAMGSGHFLVDALDVMTDRIARFLTEYPIASVRTVLSQLRETVEAEAKDLPRGVLAEIRDVELLKRVVLKRCIYGVDLNLMAVELAKLALWLDAFVPGLPLSYLDHNLKRGNSLVGVVGDEVLDTLQPREATLEQNWVVEKLGEATRRAREAVERVELRLSDIDSARAAEQERAHALSEVMSLYHRWTADSFGVQGARERIGETESLEAHADARQAAEFGHEQAFFHWSLEFPEVLTRDRPGFDVVLANPPWDKLKVERHDFFQHRLPGLKFVKSARERDGLIAELTATDPSAQQEYEQALERVQRLKRYFQTRGGNYRLHGAGDPDLFKGFAERFMTLVRPGGALGCILPRQLLGGGGAAALRKEIFENWTVMSADVLWNRRTWAFPDVFHRTRMTLLAARKVPPGPDAVLPSAGPLPDADTFRRARELEVRFGLDELRSMSPALELPSVPSPAAAGVLMKMMNHPRFDTEDRPWRAVPYRELDATADRALFNENGDGWPVWKGATFDRYRPDLAPPVYWATPEAALQRLQGKRLNSRSIFSTYSDEQLADPSTLPPHRCRILFRDVGRATDTRTMRACLAPPRVFAIHDAPQLVWLRGEPSEKLFLLAVLNSLPFDWLLRRRIETHVTFGLLNSLPVPNSREHLPRLAHLAGRLSFWDDRYAEFASELGDPCGAMSDRERSDAETEIDVLVAAAYGLTRADLEVILEDFSEKALDGDQRARLLDLFGARS